MESRREHGWLSDGSDYGIVDYRNTSIGVDDSTAKLTGNIRQKKKSEQYNNSAGPIDTSEELKKQREDDSSSGGMTTDDGEKIKKKKKSARKHKRGISIKARDVPAVEESTSSENGKPLQDKTAGVKTGWKKSRPVSAVKSTKQVRRVQRKSPLLSETRVIQAVKAALHHQPVIILPIFLDDVQHA